MLIPEDGCLPKITRTGLAPFNNIMIIKVPERFRQEGESIYEFATLDRSKQTERWPGDKFMDKLNSPLKNNLNSTLENKSNDPLLSSNEDKTDFNDKKNAKQLKFDLKSKQSMFHQNKYISEIQESEESNQRSSCRKESPVSKELPSHTLHNTFRKARNLGKGLLGEAPVQHHLQTNKIAGYINHPSISEHVLNRMPIEHFSNRNSFKGPVKNDLKDIFDEIPRNGPHRDNFEGPCQNGLPFVGPCQNVLPFEGTCQNGLPGDRLEHPRQNVPPSDHFEYPRQNRPPNDHFEHPRQNGPPNDRFEHPRQNGLPNDHFEHPRKNGPPNNHFEHPRQNGPPNDHFEHPHQNGLLQNDHPINYFESPFQTVPPRGSFKVHRNGPARNFDDSRNCFEGAFQSNYEIYERPEVPFGGTSFEHNSANIHSRIPNIPFNYDSNRPVNFNSYNRQNNFNYNRNRKFPNNVPAGSYDNATTMNDGYVNFPPSENGIRIWNNQPEINLNNQPTVKRNSNRFFRKRSQNPRRRGGRGRGNFQKN